MKIHNGVKVVKSSQLLIKKAEQHFPWTVRAAKEHVKPVVANLVAKAQPVIDPAKKLANNVVERAKATQARIEKFGAKQALKKGFNNAAQPSKRAVAQYGLSSSKQAFSESTGKVQVQKATNRVAGIAPQTRGLGRGK